MMNEMVISNKTSIRVQSPAMIEAQAAFGIEQDIKKMEKWSTRRWNSNSQKAFFEFLRVLREDANTHRSQASLLKKKA
jgi:hypothetical protein